MNANDLIEKLRPIARDLDDLDRLLAHASAVVSSCGEPMPAEHIAQMSRRASAALDMLILDLDRPQRAGSIHDTVADIVGDYLKKNGFDGLYCAGECACEADDLAPCDQLGLDCSPGFKSPCLGGDDCPLDCDCGFHIGPEKREVSP